MHLLLFAAPRFFRGVADGHSKRRQYTDDYFAYADGIADGKYIALKYNQYVGFIDKSGYLIKQVTALKQKAAEAQEKPVVLSLAPRPKCQHRRSRSNPQIVILP